jgi:hypothetical protein
MLLYMADILLQRVSGYRVMLDGGAQTNARTATKPRTPTLTPGLLAPLLGAGGMPVEVAGVAVV